MTPPLVGYVLVTLCAALAAPGLAQDTVPEPDQDLAELRKLHAMLTFVRQRNAVDYAITAPNGIDEAEYVAIGGIEQWITIRGEDRRNPVLLFLHGGPAMPRIRGAMPDSVTGSSSSP